MHCDNNSKIRVCWNRVQHEADFLTSNDHRFRFHCPQTEECQKLEVILDLKTENETAFKVLLPLLKYGSIFLYCVSIPCTVLHILSGTQINCEGYI